MKDEEKKAWEGLVKEAYPCTAAGCGCGRLFHGHYKVEWETAWRKAILAMEAEVAELQERDEASKSKIERLERQSSEAYADRDRWQLVARERLDTIREANDETKSMKRLLMEPVYKHRISEADTLLCKIKEALKNGMVGDATVVEITSALSSSSAPCPHEEVLFHARQAVITEGLARIKAEDEAQRLKKKCDDLSGDNYTAALAYANAELDRLRAIEKRAGDVEGLRVKIKHDSWPITLHDDPFILYQEGNMSKGKLCEIIAKSISAWVKEG